MTMSGRQASPRLAKLQHYRSNARGTTLVAKVTRGPQSELGRQVHLAVTKADVPWLREMLAKVEASDHE